ncbi:relaxase/mobilization nuclease domain-containing protein [Henriciella algicola]|uniref:Relaxase n=1 Tax=Henriciella algicola TaxID=1608422 RepID=A0A399RIB9_9PROT|nr:relaxase/mobilization nuclease domain-containing protein [Henriciella algicola]RIJ31038.1 relaxase [Henriciella algicola]
MILHGNQRGGARDLAVHLMKPENEHIEVHSLRGFACEDLMGAFLESEALSEGTRCRQHLFSMSFNPPPGREVSTEDFERAVAQAEEALGLSGQPRALIFHEKEARRHLHAVWSRIDGENMKAIQLSHSKMKMREVSRELFIEHGWTLPRGLANSQERDPRNFTLEEWQQAKRKGRDPREIKTAIQDAWATSDTQATLAHALEARGFRLARGDRKGVVVIDQDGEVRSLARSAGIKARDIRARLKETEALSSVEQTRNRIAEEMLGKVGEFRRAEIGKARLRKATFDRQRMSLVERQSTARESLRSDQEIRSVAEAKARQERYREGLRGLWDKMRGEHARIKAQNERETYEAYKRDQAERDRLVQRHLDQRRELSVRYEQMRETSRETRSSLREDWRKYQEMRKPQPQPEPNAETTIQVRLDWLRRDERGPPTPDRER